MKLLVDGRTIKDKPSGVGIWNLRLCSHLLSYKDIKLSLLLPKGCTYSFYTDPVFAPYLGKSLQLIETPFPYSFVTWKRFIFEQLYLPKLIDSIKPDIYHATDSFGLPLTPLPFVKTVLTIHDVIPFTPFREYMSKLKFMFYKQAVAISIKRANKVVAISDQTHDDILKYLHPLKEIKTIYNGLDKANQLSLQLKNATWEQLASLYSLQKNKYLFYFGGFGPRKNVMTVVTTFIHLKKENHIAKDCKLVLCGRITNAKKDALRNLEKIKTTLHTSKLDKSVVILDYVTETEKEILIQYSLLGLFLYHYEGFGFGPTEFLQEKKTTFLTKTGIWYSYPKENMYLLPCNLSQEEINRKIGAALQASKKDQEQGLKELVEFIDQFSWNKMTASYKDLYEELLH